MNYKSFSQNVLIKALGLLIALVIPITAWGQSAAGEPVANQVDPEAETLIEQIQEQIDGAVQKLEQEVFTVVDAKTDKAILPNGQSVYRLYPKARPIYTDASGQLQLRPEGWTLFSTTEKSQLKEDPAGYSYTIPLEKTSLRITAGNLEIPGKSEVKPKEVTPKQVTNDAQHQEITYPEFYPGIDVRFIDLQEERQRALIINERPAGLDDNDELIFWEEYQLPAGTKVTTHEGKELEAKETMELTGLEFTIPGTEKTLAVSPAVVFDDSGFNTPHVDLKQQIEYDQAAGTLRVGLVLPASYLLDDERNYPVTVDPTYQICEDDGCGVDLYLSYLYSRDHSSSELFLGYDYASGNFPCEPAGYASRHVVLQFDFSPLPDVVDVTDASVNLRRYGTRNGCGEYSGAISMRVKRIIEEWNKSSIRYTDIRSDLRGTGSPGDISSNFSQCPGGLCSWDIYNSTVERFKSGYFPNNGIVIEPTEDWDSGSAPPSSWSSKQRLFIFYSSNYGNGQYAPYLQLTFDEPDLIVENPFVSDITVNIGQTIDVSATVKNVGDTTANSSTLGYYWSTDSTCNTNDNWIVGDPVRTLDPDETSNEDIRDGWTVPSSLNEGSTYYMCFIADYNQRIDEDNENNNTAYAAFTVNQSGAPDLIVQNESVSATTVAPDQLVTASARVRNQGNASAGSSGLSYRWSTNDNCTLSDPELEYSNVDALNAGSSDNVDTAFRIPTNVTLGNTYYLCFYADPNDDVTESNEGNNSDEYIAITIGSPNLRFNSPPTVSDNTVFPDQQIEVSAVVVNSGSTQASSSSSLGYYFSTNNSWDSNDQLRAADTVAALSVDQTNSESAFITIPSNASPGQTDYIIFYIDRNGSVAESNESDNILAYPINIISSGQADPDNDGYVNVEEDFSGTDEDTPGGNNGGELFGDYFEHANIQQDIVLNNAAADPVNTRTGAFDLTQTDFLLPGRGEFIDFKRSYNSRQTAKNGRFGAGWDFSYNIYYYQDPNTNNVQLYLGGGMVARFTTNDNGQTYEPIKGQYDQLIRRQDGDLEYRTLDGIHYIFSQELTDNLGILEQIIDPNNNVTTLQYTTRDDIPLLTRITDPSGRYIELGYGDRDLGQGDKVVYLQEYAGQQNTVRLDYTYNTSNQLTRVTQTRSYDGSTDTITRNFTYDGNNQMLTYTDPRGTVLLNTYDSEGRIIRQKERKANENPGDEKTVYELDYLGAYGPAPGSTHCTLVRNFRDDNVQYTNRSCFNADEFKIYEEDGEGNYEAWTFDSSKGTVATYRDQNGNITTFNYDERRRKITETHPDINGFRTVHTYTYENNFNRMLTDTETMSKPGDPQFVPVVRTKTYTVDSNNGNVTAVEDPLGFREFFAYDQYGNVTSYTDKENTVEGRTYDNNGNYQLTSSVTVFDADGQQSILTHAYTYDAYGNQATYRTPRNHTYTYEFDNHGNLRKVINPDNSEQVYEYDLEGNLTAEVDEKGNRTEYTYDTNIEASLIETKLIDPNGPDITMTNTYDRAGNLLLETDGRGNSTEYIYNSANRVERKIRPVNTTNYTYDDAGYITRETESNGNKKEYQYDGRHNLVNTKTYTDADDFFSEQIEYDGFGRVVLTVDGNQNQTQYTYDLLDRELTITDADNNVTTYNYDNNGNKLGELRPRAEADVNLRNGDGKTISYEYDELNRVLKQRNADNKVTIFYYDANGNVVRTIDRQNLNGTDNTRETTYEYDNRDRLTKEIDAYGGEMEYAYDDVGNQTSITDARNRTVAYTYDAFNRQETMVEPGNHTTTYHYDQNSNLATVTYPDTTSTQYVYDEGNRMIREINYRGDETILGYDSVGNITRKTDQRGKIYSYTYDGANRLLTETDPASTETTYTYDGNGNRLTQNVAGKTTSFTYDNLDRVTQIINPGNKTESLSYDSEDNVLTFTDGENQVSTYTYDKLNRQSTENLNGEATVTYNYDNWDNIVSIDDTTTDTAYTYDNKNRLLQEARTFAELNQTYNVINTYHADDQLNTRTDAANRVFTHNYNNRGFLQSINYNGQALATYQYDSFGNLNSITHGNNFVTTYAYDNIQRPTNINIKNADNEDVFNHEYEYDAASNLTRLTSGEQVVNYTYDDLEQIDIVTYEAGTIDFNYDRWGNRTRVATPTGTITYQYDVDSNELVSSSQDNLTTTYTYDDNGSLIQEQHNKLGLTTKTVNYNWNVENQLQSTVYQKGARPSYVPALASQSVGYSYDSAGNRIKKSSNQGTAYYFNNGLAVLNEISAAGTVQKSIVPGINQVAEITASGDIHYIHTDRLGSTTLVSGEAGEILEEYEYDVYGSLLGERAASSVTSADEQTLYRFTNQEFDNETELYYYNARYYNPKLGRFISRDTYLGHDGETLEKNRYAYVKNNPLKYTDPTGNYCLPCIPPAVTTLAKFIGIGALVGVSAQAGSDIISGESSSVQEYTNAAAGGAVGGATTLYGGPLLGVLTGAATESIANKAYEKQQTGESIGLQDGLEVAFDIGVNALTSKIPIKIPGITDGKGSFSSIKKQILTKLDNGTIENVSNKTATKIIINDAVESAPGTLIKGIDDKYDVSDGVFDSLFDQSSGCNVNMSCNTSLPKIDFNTGCDVNMSCIKSSTSMSGSIIQSDTYSYEKNK